MLAFGGIAFDYDLTMKKFILLLVALMGSQLTLSAQDLIVKTDSTKIPSKVLEIAPDVVRFKKLSNVEGPTYVLKINDIAYIVFPNGSREEFNLLAPAVSSAVAEKPAPAVKPAPSVVEAPAQEFYEQTFRVGDLYDRNGVRGMVCEVSSDGRHGLVLSLQQMTLPWCEKGHDELLKALGINDKHDGLANMQHAADFLVRTHVPEYRLAAYAWCRKLGEGWYLPSINELLTIAMNFNGGRRLPFNRDARQQFNDALQKLGSPKMDRLMYYLSSTEGTNPAEVLTTHMAPEPPYIIPVAKTQKWLVRAVHRF